MFDYILLIPFTKVQLTFQESSVKKKYLVLLVIIFLEKNSRN